jgi:hypothetical protein
MNYTGRLYDPPENFVRERFFQFDEVRREFVIMHYSKLYGENAGRYLRDTFRKWETGSVRMSRQSELRILECVPRYMTKEDQYELLLLNAPAITNQRKYLRAWPSSQAPISVKQLHTAYVAEINTLKNSAIALTWFVKNVFTDEEIDEYVQCLRFVAIEQQLRNYTAVMTDLRQMLPLPTVQGCKVSAFYLDYLQGCCLELDNVGDFGQLKLDIDNPIPALISRIGMANAKLISDRVLRMEHKIVDGAGSVRIGIHDLHSFLNSIRRATDGPDYDANITVVGSGGSMHIEIKKRSIARLGAKVTELELYWLMYAVGGIGGALYLFSINLWFVAAIAGFVGYVGIQNKSSEIAQLKKEMRDYESWH